MLASYAQGRGDRSEVDRLFSLGIILSVGCGMIFFAVLYFAGTFINADDKLFWRRKNYNRHGCSKFIYADTWSLHGDY